ncbi:MAG: sigma-70 family RNA polymerase sigma factor [Oscillospiraceae bacterium]|nr:sigma-70 family RNA polymerase sigma factor [Oscillospiraceae bacterium]
MTGQSIASRFDEIYNFTYKSVVSLVTSKCGNTADIGDIVQDTYMELYRLLNRRGADYIQNEKAMTLKIAKRKLSKYYSLSQRFRNFVPLMSVNEEGEEVPLSDLESATSQTSSIEDFTINKMLIEEAWRVLEAKPQIIQKIFYLYYEGNLTIPEIAQTLSLTESGVKNKLYRTLKELRELLQ